MVLKRKSSELRYFGVILWRTWILVLQGFIRLRYLTSSQELWKRLDRISSLSLNKLIEFDINQPYKCWVTWWVVIRGTWMLLHSVIVAPLINVLTFFGLNESTQKVTLTVKAVVQVCEPSWNVWVIIWGTWISVLQGNICLRYLTSSQRLWKRCDWISSLSLNKSIKCDTDQP